MASDSIWCEQFSSAFFESSLSSQLNGDHLSNSIIKEDLINVKSDASAGARFLSD